MGFDRIDICPQHAFPAHGVDQPNLHAGQFNVRWQQVPRCDAEYRSRPG